ncbi:MAG: hypothetical protein ACYCWW_09995 [Deltaproteobacteria bacterium]
MDRRLALGGALALLGACSGSFSANVSGTFLGPTAPGGGSASASSGGTSGGGTSGSSSSGGGTVGGTASDGGLRGASCDPAVPSSCAAGLICDSASSRCRLPGYGESCDPSLGCGGEPVGMSCATATWTGNSRALCLIPCAGADSTDCPYLMSCGNPELPGYCSPSGGASCAPWQPCELGPRLTGSCIPELDGTICTALGSVTSPYGACDPLAANHEASLLCGAGMLCLPSPDPAAASTDGECVPLCASDGGPTCQSDEHCAPAPGWPFGTCRRGSPCAVGDHSCFAEATCVPDRAVSPYGGCLASAPDAGLLGAGCSIGASLGAADPGEDPCAPGLACLPDADGGESCAAPCLLDGTDPYACQGGSCTPLSNDPPDASIGSCQ